MRKRSPILQKVIDDAGECELCGSKRNLEVHHCVPVVCGGDDSDDNLICVCRSCHVKLTPHSLLIKIGQRKNSEKEKFKKELYELIQKKLDDANGNMFPGMYSELIFDAIDEL